LSTVILFSRTGRSRRRWPASGRLTWTARTLITKRLSFPTGRSFCSTGCAKASARPCCSCRPSAERARDEGAEERLSRRLISPLAFTLAQLSKRKQRELPRVEQGIGAPRNTPTEIVDKLNREINLGLADPTIKARLADLGSRPFISSPADFGMFIAEETEMGLSPPQKASRGATARGSARRTSSKIGFYTVDMVDAVAAEPEL